MKAYKYIFKKSMLSFLGALLIISAIDFSFNFFSEIEDINEKLFIFRCFELFDSYRAISNEKFYLS